MCALNIEFLDYSNILQNNLLASVLMILVGGSSSIANPEFREEGPSSGPTTPMSFLCVETGTKWREEQLVCSLCII